METRDQGGNETSQQLVSSGKKLPGILTALKEYIYSIQRTSRKDGYHLCHHIMLSCFSGCASATDLCLGVCAVYSSTSPATTTPWAITPMSTIRLSHLPPYHTPSYHALHNSSTCGLSHPPIGVGRVIIPTSTDTWFRPRACTPTAFQYFISTKESARRTKPLYKSAAVIDQPIMLEAGAPV